MAVKVRDETAVVVDAVVRLVRCLKALLRDRLEAQEQRFATAPCRELDEFLVARGVGSALARPPLFERTARWGPAVFVGLLEHRMVYQTTVASYT